MGRRGGEEDTVESRKLKVESQPERGRIQRPEKLPDKVGAGGAGADAEHAEIMRRCGLRSGVAGMEAQYQTLCYHVGTILVKE